MTSAGPPRKGAESVGRLWKCSRHWGQHLRGLEVRTVQLGVSQGEHKGRHGCSLAGDRGMTGQRGDRARSWKPLCRGKDWIYPT